MQTVVTKHPHTVTLVLASLVLGLVPMLVGAGIYFSYRPLHLPMFDWARTIGVLDALLQLRSWTQAHLALNGWVVGSLPDGIWVFSATAVLVLIWTGYNSWVSTAIVLLPFCLSIVAEIGQCFRLVPGMFDPLDILASCVGCALAVVVCRSIPRRT